jgi:hypothetical protein
VDQIAEHYDETLDDAAQGKDPEQLVLPGLPAGFLAYQINYRCSRGCNHNSAGYSVDGGGRGTAVRDEQSP